MASVLWVMVEYVIEMAVQQWLDEVMQVVLYDSKFDATQPCSHAEGGARGVQPQASVRHIPVTAPQAANADGRRVLQYANTYLPTHSLTTWILTSNRTCLSGARAAVLRLASTTLCCGGRDPQCETAEEDGSEESTLGGASLAKQMENVVTASNLPADLERDLQNILPKDPACGGG
ncbi:hypothetical protein AC579_5796 [Pseudocercospora musae]|uniref:Uncharacterized protein n=1 Tax=Pseudocercospora musae TaxID=113226 RepID=A0A139IRK9_9PEZI|nr:hypothetical protein AC579_5796 [Pseudocercospora musae]